MIGNPMELVVDEGKNDGGSSGGGGHNFQDGAV